MQKIRFAVAIAAILVVTAGHAQPALPDFPPAPPFEELAAQGPQIGLIATVREALPMKSLMVTGRQLTPDELRSISRADEVAEVLGITGQSYLGSFASLAKAPGAFQHGIRAHQRAEYAEAAEALTIVAQAFPDVKIVHRYLGNAKLALGDTSTAMRHLATSIGYIPPEDDAFVAILRASTDFMFANTYVMPQTRWASVATRSRSAAALLLLGRKVDSQQTLASITTIEVAAIPYPELAASAITEIAIAAEKRRVEMVDDGAQNEVAVESLLMAVIGACDGRWRQDCLPNIDVALSLYRDTESRRLAACAAEIATYVISGAWEGARGTVPASARALSNRYPDMPMLQKLVTVGS